MSVLTDLEKSNIYKKMGEFLIANPDVVEEESLPEISQYTKDMVRIHIYYAKNAVKRQKKKIEHAMAKFDYERNQAYQEWKREQEDNKSQYVAETFARWGELIK